MNEPIPAEPSPDAIKAAGDSVKSPAICLIVVGVLSLMNLICVAVSYFLFFQASIDQARAQLNAGPNPEQMAWARDFLDWYEKVLGVGLPIQMPLILIAGILILFGAVKMLKLKSIGWARTAAILAMIPMISGCCVLGLVFGIWSLILLAKPEVKAAFAAKSKPALGEH